jgi:hypothetical protein
MADRPYDPNDFQLTPTGKPDDHEQKLKCIASHARQLEQMSLDDVLRVIQYGATLRTGFIP